MRLSSRTLWIVGLLVVLTVGWAGASVWLYNKYNATDWLPIVLSGLALIIALATTVWSSLEQRRHLTLNFAMTMWDRWSNPEMTVSRNCAWEALRNETVEGGRKRLGRLKASSSTEYNAIARVNHFLADLHDLVAAGLIDPRELKGLFRDTLQAYYCHLCFGDISDAFPDDTGEAHQMWFDEKVLGLGRRLGLDKAGGYHRYRNTFEANERAARVGRFAALVRAPEQR